MSVRWPWLRYAKEQCAFCDAWFRANAVVHHYPVGRRIAYEPARGTLWTVCQSCGRWNMARLEEAERAQAIEELEQHFHGSRTRAGSGGVETALVQRSPWKRVSLLRVGRVTPSGFAAWRFVRQMRWRRMFYLNYFVVVYLLQLYPPMNRVTDTLPGIVAYVAGAGLLLAAVMTLYTVARVRLPDGRLAKLVPWHERKARLERSGDGWVLVLTHSLGETRHVGDEAKRLLGRLLARVNADGGMPDDLDAAIEVAARAGDVDRLILELMKPEAGVISDWRLANLPAEVAMAMEMLLHEAEERRALSGSLALARSAAAEAGDQARIAATL